MGEICPYLEKYILEQGDIWKYHITSSGEEMTSVGCRCLLGMFCTDLYMRYLGKGKVEVQHDSHGEKGCDAQSFGTMVIDTNSRSQKRENEKALKADPIRKDPIIHVGY